MINQDLSALDYQENDALFEKGFSADRTYN